MSQAKGNKAKGRQSTKKKGYYAAQAFTTNANKLRREIRQKQWLNGRHEKHAALSKHVRDYRKITQVELADLCGVSERTVQGWEQGRAPSRSCRILLNQLSAQRPPVAP